MLELYGDCRLESNLQKGKRAPSLSRHTALCTQPQGTLR